MAEADFVLPPAPEQQTEHAQALGSSERFFVSLRAVSATNLARVIAIEGVLPAQRIAWALRQLQARHPLLRARIEPSHFVHQATPSALTLRCEARRDDSHWQRALRSLLDTPLRTPLELHYLQGEFAARSELIVLADHAISDGVSINALCAELLSSCGGASLRTPRELRPVLERMLPRSSLFEQAHAVSGALLKLSRIAIRRGKKPRAQSTSYLHAELDEAHTSRLIARSRAHGTTLTGALMAAVAHALNEPKLALSVPINLRPQLPQLSAEDLGNYTSVAYLEARRADFWPEARRLKAQLEPQLAATSAIYRLGRLFVRRQRPLAHAMISNSGLVPIARDYGAFRVAAFHSATSAPMLSADYAFFCNTLHGKLTLNLVYAPQVVSREQAQRVLGLTVEKLRHV
jgi:hypothetical protein